MNFFATPLTCLIVGGGLTVFGTMASAQTMYTVTELPTKAAGGAQHEAYAMSIDAKGKVLAFVVGEAVLLGEVCRSGQCKVLPPAGSQFRAMSKTGVVVGGAPVAGVWWAVRHEGGITTSLVPGLANGVNSHGVTVGQTQSQQPFSFDSAVTVLPTLGGPRGDAKAINDAGVMVGYSNLANGQTRATKWVGGVPSDLGALEAGTYSKALGVNAKGVVVGCSDGGQDSNIRAVKFVDGAVIEYKGGLVSCAFAMNRAGVAVGEMSTEAKPESHAWVAEGGSMVALHTRISEADQAKYELLWAAGINDAGQIAVSGVRRADAAAVALRLDPLN